MRDIPIETLLSFPIPNYENPVLRGPVLLYINSVLLGITLALVLLRVYTRVFLQRWMGADDWLILIAAIFTVGLTICVLLANEKFYWDRHIWDVPFIMIPKLGQVAMAAKLLFTLATFFTRVSLLSFYYRLLHDTTLKTYRIVLHAAGIFNALVLVSFVFLTIFQCSPIAAYWHFPASGKCIDEGKLMFACGIINCFLDLLVTTLPIPMVMMLRMRQRQRIGVIILLSLGFVVTIAGVTRTFFIWKSLIASYDETWYAYPLWIAAAVEVDLAVICACAPAVRPFLLLCVGPLVTSLSGSRSVRSHKKGDGYTLTRSLPSSRGNLAAEVTFDAKINAIDTVRDDGKTPTVKLSLSKTPIDGKLKIMHRVSWNVDYGDRSEPLNPDDLSVPQNDYDIGIALSTPSEEKRQLKPGGRGSHSVDIVEASRQHSLNLSPSLQSLASNSHFVRTESNRPLSKCGHTPQPQGIDEETFWRSDSESNHGSTTPDRNSEDQDQEQRWNIRRNSFRNEQHGVFLLPQTRSDEGARAMEMKALSWPTRSPM